MYNLILQLATFSSLAVIVYLMARAVPRVKDDGAPAHAPGAFDRLLSKLPLEAMDARLNSASEKVLRKLKVFVMKVDNLLNQYLKRVRKSGSEKRDRGLFNGE